MIRHIVFIKFRPEISDADISMMFEDLQLIKEKLPEVLSLTSGLNKSPENMERGYMHGFVIDFTDWEAFKAYQAHPDHRAFGAKLVANAVDGKDGILCFDLEVSSGL